MKKLTTQTVSIKAPVIGDLKTPRKRGFTPDQIKFLEENVRGKPFSEVTVLFNKHFKTDFTKMQIKGFCVRKGIRSGLSSHPNTHCGSKEELSFLENMAQEKNIKDLTVLLNNALNLSLTCSQVFGVCKKYKIKIRPLREKWTEEIIDFIRKNSNESSSCLTMMIKNTFGIIFTKKQVAGYILYDKHKTMLNKNDRYKASLNTERIRKSGRIYIKVSMTGSPKKQWQEKHRWVWEQEHGKIPEGMNVFFLDNNPLNCTLKNLALVSRAESIIMKRNGLFTDNPEATLAGIAVARLSLTIHSRLKKTIGSEGHRRFVCRESSRRMRQKKRERTDMEGKISFRFSKEMNQWLLENIHGKTYREITQLFNIRFNV
jgi:hypothetical protein